MLTFHQVIVFISNIFIVTICTYSIEWRLFNFCYRIIKSMKKLET